MEVRSPVQPHNLQVISSKADCFQQFPRFFGSGGAPSRVQTNSDLLCNKSYKEDEDGLDFGENMKANGTNNGDCFLCEFLCFLVIMMLILR